MEWAKIDDKTYQYDEGGVRFFLLLGDREALLIDSGMQVHNAKELAEGNNEGLWTCTDSYTEFL